MNYKPDDFIGKRTAVAVSGGADSMALLHMCRDCDATVLHVDHGLRKTSAKDSELVARAAAELGLPFVLLKWTGEKPKTGVEAAARTARYELLLNWCRENKVEILLVAHNADDQIETFLMNLGRGSGVYGLAAMPAAQDWDGILVVRPVLDTPHAALEKYCADNKIKYIHDEMNDDENFTRVKIRKNRHLLHDKLGISDERILTAVKNLDRVRFMLENDVDDLIKSVTVGGRAVFSEKFLSDMPGETRLKFLSRLFQIIGKSAYGPRLEKIERADYMLQSDCKFTINNCIVRRFKNKIMAAPEGASVSFRKKK
ncbi:MAG: tRNA lysidine(34) synthetase TilS [Alphaproteobacteria bacterium]|nr:tRNA lysidine(34) synthetase TilS [Alphaproteobacteria bacterium]